MRRNLFALSTTAAVFGCALLAPEASLLDVRTDRPEYVRDTATGLAAIHLTVTNQGHVPAYLVGCPRVPSFVVEREQQGAWRDAFQVNVICQAIYTSSQLTLMPSQSHKSALGWDASGTFRLRVMYGTKPGNAWGRAAVSPPFAVR